MADRRLFEEALKRGADYAWKGQWTQAAEEYRLAHSRFPKDISARGQLAMALFRSGQLEAALKLYELLWKEQPTNRAWLLRVAELQEALGDRESAAASYRLLAEMQSRLRSYRESLRSWKKVVALKPADPLLWHLLMDVAELAGATAEAMPGYLELARELAMEGRFQEAILVTERAQLLDPAHPWLMPLLSALRRGLEYPSPAAQKDEGDLQDVLAHLFLEQKEDKPSPPGLEEEATPVPSSGDGRGEIVSQPPEVAQREEAASAELTVQAVEVPEEESLESLPAPPVPDEAESALEEESDLSVAAEEAATPEIEPVEAVAAEEESLSPKDMDEARPAADELASEEESDYPSDVAETPSAEDELASEVEVVQEEPVEVEITSEAPSGAAIAEQLIALSQARLYLSARQLDFAEAEARRALQLTALGGEEAHWEAAGLLLDTLVEIATDGDLGGTALGLHWMRCKLATEQLPAPLAERMAVVSTELFGQCASRYLEEIVSLPSDSRVETILALRRSEERLEAGRLRTAADEMYRLIELRPEFLPAQWLLGRTLAAQGRVSEARELGLRLSELYEIRGLKGQAEDVLEWLAELDASSAGEMLENGRAAEASPAGYPSSDAGAGLESVAVLQQEEAVEVGPAEVHAEGDAPALEALLSLAEGRFAEGDREGACNVVRAALEGWSGIDDATRVALLRVLQITGLGEGMGEELVEGLRLLGLPEELAD